MTEAQFIFAADQSYERAKERLNGVIEEQVANMEAAPDQNDATQWALSLVMLVGAQDTRRGNGQRNLHGDRSRETGAAEDRR